MSHHTRKDKTHTKLESTATSPPTTKLGSESKKEKIAVHCGKVGKQAFLNRNKDQENISF